MTSSNKIFNLILLIIFAFLYNHVKAQDMTSNDFQINGIRLKMSYDSIESRFGTPDSVRTFNGEWEEFTAHYYPQIVFWTNNNDHRIWTIDIYDTTFVTFRGVKIGDSVAKIDKLYPTKKLDTHHDEFGRVGPYDTSFDEYTDYRLYDYMPNVDEGWILILFSKEGILTKILFYVGVPE